MNINELYPSDFIRAADLKGNEHKLVIDRVEQKDMGDGKSKPVVYFQSAKKGLVLNKTNAMTIASYYGPETNAWRGREIILYPVKVPFQGQMTDAVRIRALSNGPAPARRAAPAQNAAAAVGFEDDVPPRDAMDDDIPF